MTKSLDARVATCLTRKVDPAISAFAARVAQENDAIAVLFYGSNLRTGELEGVLDYYALTDGAPERGLWPRVSYREWEYQGSTLRAKIATMTLDKFNAAVTGNLVDSTIWARFVQPSALVWCDDRNDLQCETRKQIISSIAQAARTASRLAVALGPLRGTEWDYWRALFRATYQAEFRVEKPGRENSILTLNSNHFDGLLCDALDAEGVSYDRAGDVLTPHMSADLRKHVQNRWGRSRRWGKLLNLSRLVRATHTFDGAGRYAAWKVERHTGVKITMTPWRERHPLLAAPGVFWQLWRAQKTR